MIDQVNMAIIITCYNRKDMSIKCVKDLEKAASIVSGLVATFYIWDDGSTDGTADALKTISNNVKIYRGSGGFYWSKGMYFALTEAVKREYDLYLMVNDDVAFFDNSLDIMIESYNAAGGHCGIVGSTAFKGVHTYGGKDSKYADIIPNGELQECRYSNWNCFLIDRFVIENVGLICPRYAHSFGDFDYSCRMQKCSIKQYVAPKYIGECEKSFEKRPYFDSRNPLAQRFKMLFSPKGLPVISFIRFHWSDKGIKGVIIAFISYVVVLFRVLIAR